MLKCPLSSKQMPPTLNQVLLEVSSVLHQYLLFLMKTNIQYMIILDVKHEGVEVGMNNMHFFADVKTQMIPVMAVLTIWFLKFVNQELVPHIMCHMFFWTYIIFFAVGISLILVDLYCRAGHEAVLPCAIAASSDETCSGINWLYSSDLFQTVTEVQSGKVETSARAARLMLADNCSLVISNITAKDAGHYTCRKGSNTDSSLHLRVLTSKSHFHENSRGNSTLITIIALYQSQSPLLTVCCMKPRPWFSQFYKKSSFFIILRTPL